MTNHVKLNDEDSRKSIIGNVNSGISKWQNLKNRLNSGILMSSLKAIEEGRNPNKPRSSKYSKPVTLNAKLIVLEAIAQQEAVKRRNIERAKRRAFLKKQKKFERHLADQQFPTIMGFYFDGFFTPHFKLNEEYAGIFNELELEISKKKEAAYKETFLERTKRNFWPPKLIGGFMFRTKGVYLDFKEVLKDPPHTPPDIIIDPRLLQDAVDAEMGIKTDNKYGDGPSKLKKQKQQIKQEKKIVKRKPDDFYFSNGKFFQKDPLKKYVLDDGTGVWKLNSENSEANNTDASTPEDYEFNVDQGVYKLKNADNIPSELSLPKKVVLKTTTSDESEFKTTENLDFKSQTSASPLALKKEIKGVLKRSKSNK